MSPPARSHSARSTGRGHTAANATDAVVTPGAPLSAATAISAIDQPVLVGDGDDEAVFDGDPAPPGPSEEAPPAGPCPPAGSKASATFCPDALQATAPASAGRTATVTSVAALEDDGPEDDVPEPLPKASTMASAASGNPPDAWQPVPAAAPLTAYMAT